MCDLQDFNPTIRQHFFDHRMELHTCSSGLGCINIVPRGLSFGPAVSVFSYCFHTVRSILYFSSWGRLYYLISKRAQEVGRLLSAYGFNIVTATYFISTDILILHRSSPCQGGFLSLCNGLPALCDLKNDGCMVRISRH